MDDPLKRTRGLNTPVDRHPDGNRKARRKKTALARKAQKDQHHD